MPAIGQVQFSVSGVVNISPYTIPIAATLYGGNFKVQNGYLNRTFDGNVGFYLTAAQTDDVVKSRVEAGPGGFVRHGPAVVNTSNNGYYVSIRANEIRAFRVDNGAQQVSGSILGITSGTFTAGQIVELNYTDSTGLLEVFVDGTRISFGTDITYQGTGVRPGYHVNMAGFNDSGAVSWAGGDAVAVPDYTQRKGSTFTATHTLGTITTATLNAVNVFDHVSSQAAGAISFTGAVTDERTTSGVVNLVLGDGAATQTQTVQVNVFGVVPSNNPAQKDGSALASLTGVQIRITAGANLNGTQVYYSGTETTNASGNFSTLDVSTSAAVAADPVRMQVLTAAGDSITSAETVELI
jgi:hypothetical protein